jgi:hypothetical protein
MCTAAESAGFDQLVDTHFVLAIIEAGRLSNVNAGQGRSTRPDFTRFGICTTIVG